MSLHVTTRETRYSFRVSQPHNSNHSKRLRYRVHGSWYVKGQMASNTFTNRKPFKPPRPANQNSTTIDSSSNAFNSSPPLSPAQAPPRHEPDSSQAHPSTPPALLSRMIHDSFKNQDTRITKDALTVMEKYIDIFTREALARCVFNKKELVEKGESAEDGFLEVDDLERIVAQLLLDF